VFGSLTLAAYFIGVHETSILNLKRGIDE